MQQTIISNATPRSSHLPRQAHNEASNYLPGRLGFTAKFTAGAYNKSKCPLTKCTLRIAWHTQHLLTVTNVSDKHITQQ